MCIEDLSVVPLGSSERAVIAYQSHPGFSNMSPTADMMISSIFLWFIRRGTEADFMTPVENWDADSGAERMLKLD